MSTEEPQAVVAAAPEESAADSSTGNNSNSSTAEAVAAAAAAAAAAAQLAAASSSPEVAFPGQLFPTLFVVDFSFVKAGNITEVVEISWIVFDVATRQSLEEVSVLVRPELLLAPADLLSSLGVTQEQLFTALLRFPLERLYARHIKAPRHRLPSLSSTWVARTQLTSVVACTI